MDVAGIITALAALIAALGSFWNNRKLKQVGKEVKTLNSQTIAQLADADESRRIEKIPVKKRTPLEKSHLTEVGKK